MSAARPVCFTVDCDALGEHHGVWGLPAPSPDAAARFWLEGVAAAHAFLQERNIPATFFVIGSRVPDAGRKLLQKIATVHEIGNHTWTHPWDLTRMEEASVMQELARNHEFLTEIGAAPCGFRSPGYHLPPQAAQSLIHLGYRYSSSQLTGILYPLAKKIASIGLRLRGRRTRTVEHPWTDAFTPRPPYHPDARHPSRRGNAPFWEIPIAASTWGLPAVGPLVHAVPGGFGFATLRFRPWVLNFHLTDFIDERAFPELAHADPMLRVPREKRLRNIDRLLVRAARQGRPFCTLSQLCDQLDTLR